MNGWEAESDAAALLNGLGVDTEHHYTLMSDMPSNLKVKVLLAKALFGNPDILLLDEPTNHLDIYSIEVLEDALEDFDGTMLVVSHNRHFLDTVCNTIYYLDENGLTKFKGNYEDYKESLKNNKSNPIATDIETKEEQKLSYQEQKELSKKISKCLQI